MTTTDKPLVLLWIPESGPYRQALECAGLDAHVEVVSVPMAEEPTPDLLAFRAGEHPFWVTENITVLPHIGGLHPERDHIVAGLFVENLERFLEGRALRETVDRARGY